MRFDLYIGVETTPFFYFWLSERDHNGNSDLNSNPFDEARFSVSFANDTVPDSPAIN
jgi:hypothetical protein